MKIEAIKNTKRHNLMLKHDAIHEENILVEQAEIFGFQQAAGGGGVGLF